MLGPCSSVVSPQWYRRVAVDQRTVSSGLGLVDALLEIHVPFASKTLEKFAGKMVDHFHWSSISKLSNLSEQFREFGKLQLTNLASGNLTHSLLWEITISYGKNITISMVIFHSKLLVITRLGKSQRIPLNHHFPMVFLWFSPAPNVTRLGTWRVDQVGSCLDGDQGDQQSEDRLQGDPMAFFRRSMD